MVEPLQLEPIIEKLLEKTKQGRLSWEEHGPDSFRCQPEPGMMRDRFYVWKDDDGYGVRMEDAHQRVLFTLKAEEEIVYLDDQKKSRFALLSDLYELARRRALNVPDRLASVAELLDKI